MKQLIYILSLLFTFQQGYGQEPGKTNANSDQNQVVVKAKEERVSKSKLKVNRDTKEVYKSDDLENTELNLRVKAPNTFNYQYAKYLNSSTTNKDYTALKNAYKLEPNNKELYFEMAKYYELSADANNKKNICLKLKGSLSADLREYGYNTLMSVEQNGILITYGENDTYPIWVLQELEGVRKDVKVLNYDLLINNQYRTTQTSKLGLKLAKSYVNNINVLKDVAVNNPNKSVYYSLTVSHLILKELKTKLYTTGLALKYSIAPLKNSESIKTNWENKFNKTALKSSNKSYLASKIEMNYLLPLIQLGNYYKSINKQKEYEEVKEIALAIADRNGKKSKVKKLFKK
jgi:hypothetical protein